MPLLPPALSEHAPEIDALFGALLAVTAIGVALVWGSIALAIARRGRSESAIPTPTDEGLAPNLLFLVVFASICAFFFHRGFVVFLDRRLPSPTDAVVVKVQAQQWSFAFEHPNGVVQMNELVLPVGRPVRFEVTSADVVHSFDIPELRVRAMAVPGHVDVFTATPTRLTDPEHPIEMFCGSDCGETSAWPQRDTGHSTMRARLRVVSPEQYESGWLTDQGLGGPSPCDTNPLPMDPEICWGEMIYVHAGCRACHSTDFFVQKPAPSFANLWGSTVPLEGGGSARVDEDYVAESVRFPWARIVRGYEHMNMPPYRFSDQEIRAVVAFLRSLAPPLDLTPTTATDARAPRRGGGAAARGRAGRRR